MDLNDLCEWRTWFASERAHDEAHARHVAFHEREYIRSIVIDAVLRKAARVGFVALREREREIIRAFNADEKIPA